jgi:hypothetical protein
LTDPAPMLSPIHSDAYLLDAIHFGPRVGASRPVPIGTTLPLSPGCREAMALPFRLSQRHLGRQSQESLSGGRDSGHRGLVPIASAMAPGAPHDAQRWWGKRAPANAVGARSAAEGEGAQRPKNRRLRRPPKRSEVPVPLMPFHSFRRIWSFSGRSAGFLLMDQGNLAPTASFLPDHFWFLLVGGRVGVALVSAGLGGVWFLPELMVRGTR